MSNSKKVIILGGHGRVALLAAKKLVSEGFDVTSVFRNPDHEDEVAETGASTKTLDISTLGAKEWDETLQGFDIIVWSAGAGGKGGPEATMAIDRDAAIASMKAAERSEKKPHYIMVSFFNSNLGNVPRDSGLYTYAQAKKVADEYLLESGLTFTILGPTILTTETAQGIHVVSTEEAASIDPGKTSRDLVADTIVYAAKTGKPANEFVHFFDGDQTVEEALG